MGIHNWSPKSKMQMKQVLLVCYEHNLCECSVGSATMTADMVLAMSSTLSTLMGMIAY